MPSVHPGRLYSGRTGDLAGAQLLHFRKMPGSSEAVSGHELNAYEEQRGGPGYPGELAQRYQEEHGFSSPVD